MRGIKMKDIIFDTDFGSDCDDVMALAYLIYAEKQLDTRINPRSNR